MSNPFDTHLPMAQTRWARLLAFVLFLALVSCLGACATAPEPKPPVKLALGQVERGVVIWLPDNVLFEFGAHTLSPEADAYLSEVARLTLGKTKDQRCLEGHPDSVANQPFHPALTAPRAHAWPGLFDAIPGVWRAGAAFIFVKRHVVTPAPRLTIHQA